MRSALLFILLLCAGCYTSVPDSLARLKSKWSRVRRDAADSIRHAGSPPETVAPLLEAARNETDPKALGAELLALGVSGSPAAERIICEEASSPDPAVKRWAAKAFWHWLPQNPGRPACVGAAPATTTAPATPSASSASPVAAVDVGAADVARSDAGSADAQAP